MDDLTIRIQNDYFEVEYYNKAIQSNSTDEANSRLEFRSKALSKFGNQKTIQQLAPYWKNRLNAAIANYEPLLVKCNDILMKKWDEEKGFETKSFSEFIRKYQENIFSSKQLIDLFQRIGVKNPKQSAYRFKKNNDIEYISQNNLKFYAKIINKSIRNFMDSKLVV